MTKHTTRPRVHTERDTAIFHAYLAGESLATVAGRHGISRERVRKILQREGVTPRRPHDSVKLRHQQLATLHAPLIEAEFDRLGSVAAVARRLSGHVPQAVVRLVLKGRTATPHRRPTAGPDRRLSDAHVMTAIRRADTLGITTAAAYAAWRLGDDTNTAPSLALIQHRYGGWNKARQLAGLPVRPHHGAASTRWTDADIKEFVARFVTACTATGTAPTERAYTTWAAGTPGAPSFSTVRSRTRTGWLDLVAQVAR
jgi:hypothetical protein